MRVNFKVRRKHITSAIIFLMKVIYDRISTQCSKIITQAYTNSFSLGIKCLHPQYHNPIYAIYSFFRLGDEIVDSFHDYPKKKLLEEYKKATYEAIEQKISLNPILNNFQQVVHAYQVEHSLIDIFFDSMAMDLTRRTYTQDTLEKYILGSAEVVGLMCLKIFCENDEEKYRQLKPYAMKLSSAFQKINFLRDLHTDYKQLGRTYFPHINFEQFSDTDKRKIEEEVGEDFKEALIGIKMLPRKVKFGVYLAYKYYKRLLQKIRKTPSSKVLYQRIRIPSYQKYAMIFSVSLRYNLSLL